MVMLLEVNQEPDVDQAAAVQVRGGRVRGRPGHVWVPVQVQAQMVMLLEVNQDPDVDQAAAVQVRGGRVRGRPGHVWVPVQVLGEAAVLDVALQNCKLQN